MSRAEVAAKLIDTFVQDVGTILTCPPSKEKSWWLDHQSRWLDIGMLDPDLVIDAIAEFPVILSGLEYPEGDAAHIVIQNAKTYYQDFSLWLKHVVLWKQKIPGLDSIVRVAWEQDIQLQPRDRKLVHVYPAVKEAEMLYLLAQGVHLKSSTLRSLFPSALALWVCALCSSSRRSLFWNGITGEPVILGKTDFREYKSSAIGKFKDLDVSYVEKQDLPEWIRELHWNEMLDQLLITEAQNVSKNDGFFDVQYFQPSLEVAQKVNALRNPAMQVAVRLSDGSLFESGGKHRKLPKGCKPKGFISARQKSKEYLKKLNKKAKMIASS